MSASAILLPSKINTHYWIHCIDPKIEKKFPYVDGKFVMFFPKDEIDERWKDVNILYKKGKLIGINSMKVSTQKKNHEGINKYKNGVIIFYCGPSENKQLVLEYGRNLLKYIYYNDSTLYYKSEKPHLKDFTRRYNNLYTIDVDEYYRRPRRDYDKLSINQSTVYNYKLNNQAKPQERQNYFAPNVLNQNTNFQAHVTHQTVGRAPVNQPIQTYVAQAPINYQSIHNVRSQLNQIPVSYSSRTKTSPEVYPDWSLSRPQTQFVQNFSFNPYEKPMFDNNFYNFIPQFEHFNNTSSYQPFSYQSPYLSQQNIFYPSFFY